MIQKHAEWGGKSRVQSYDIKRTKNSIQLWSVVDIMVILMYLVSTTADENSKDAVQ